MADVISRGSDGCTVHTYIQSVNTPDYDSASWLINPDLSGVGGEPVKYWKVVGDTVEVKDQTEKDSTDDCIAENEANEITFEIIQDQDGNDSEPIPMFRDKKRQRRRLSVESPVLVFAKDFGTDSDWIPPANVLDAANGYIMPYRGVVTKAVCFSINDNDVQYRCRLWINDASEDNFGPVSREGQPGEQTFTDITLNQNFVAGDKIRIRMNKTGSNNGRLNNIVILLFVRYRSNAS